MLLSGKTFKEPKNLANHVKRVHENASGQPEKTSRSIEVPVPCQVCGKEYVRLPEMSNHLLKAHTYEVSKF
jgi:uncharacterized C2H2 Zn-finger protein